MSGGGVTPSPTPDPVQYAKNVFYRGSHRLIVNSEGAVIVGNYTSKEHYAVLDGPPDAPISQLTFHSLAEDREESPEYASEISEAIRQYGAQTSYNPMSVQDILNGTITVNGETITVVDGDYSPKIKPYE